MDAWGKAQNAEEIIMAGDANAELTKDLGLELDCSAFGMGTRSERYAIIIDNGKVTHPGVDSDEIKLSVADAVIRELQIF